MINMTYFSPKRIKKGSIQIVRLYQTYAFNMSMPNEKERLFKTKVGQASTGI
jgi:hypothetical protein